MSKIVKYEDIPKQEYINIDTIYQNGGYQDAMSLLMRVRNGGGFRPWRILKNPKIKRMAIK